MGRLTQKQAHFAYERGLDGSKLDRQTDSYSYRQPTYLATGVVRLGRGWQYSFAGIPWDRPSLPRSPAKCRERLRFAIPAR